MMLNPKGKMHFYYKDIKLYDDSDKDLDVQMNEILERRRQEAEMESQLEETSFDVEDAD